MSTADYTYLSLLNDVLLNGAEKTDPDGGYTSSVFGRQLRFNLTEAFPLPTVARVFWRGVAEELFWFLRGPHLLDEKAAEEYGARIWSAFAEDAGELDPLPGHQWRSWTRPDGETIDQIQQVLTSLREAPDSRRHLVSAWNPGNHHNPDRPPQHLLFHFYSHPMSIAERMAANAWDADFNAPDDETIHADLDAEGIPRRALHCQLYQRAGSCVSSLPSNIASYALLTHLVAQVTGHHPATFVHALGETFLHEAEIDDARAILSRTPSNGPVLHLNPEIARLEDFCWADLHLQGYEPAPTYPAVAG